MQGSWYWRVFLKKKKKNYKFYSKFIFEYSRLFSWKKDKHTWCLHIRKLLMSATSALLRFEEKDLGLLKNKGIFNVWYTSAYTFINLFSSQKKKKWLQRILRTEVFFQIDITKEDILTKFFSRVYFINIKNLFYI